MIALLITHPIATVSALTGIGFVVMVGVLFGVDGWLKLRKAHAAHRELRLSFFRGPG